MRFAATTLQPRRGAARWRCSTRWRVPQSHKLIARVFDIGPHTVNRHVANTLGRLGLASRG